MVEYPNQQVSRSEKDKDSFYKPTYDYLISKAITLNPKNELIAWLDSANGMISTTSLNYLTSPLKDKETEKTLGKFPGEIRDTDLVNMIRERNMGEYIGLPYKFTVTVNNNDSVLRRDLEVREEVNKVMQQALINMLNKYYEQVTEQGQVGINTGIQSKEVPDIEKFAKDFIEKWIDKRAIDGFNILKLINDVNDFDSKRIQSFFYWWACEEFYTYREIINNEVYTSVVSPLEGYPIYNDEQFVEDFTGFVIKKKTTLTKVKSLYWNKLSKLEKDYLEGLAKNANSKYTTSGTWLASRTWDTSKTGDYLLNSTKEYDVTDNYEALDEYTIIWRTEVPVKIRTFVDPFGQEREEVVPEEYVSIDDIDTNVRIEWIEEIYIGKRFGNETSGVYLKPEPCDVQRYDKHTMSPKLPVGGKKGILRNIKQNPIPKRLIPYVLIDRMVLLQQERTMAKYEGYIKIIPKSLFNDDIAGTQNEKMFYLKADNTLFYDDASVDFNTVAQGLRIIAMPEVANYLMTLINIRDKYKAEALEIANMNSYRLGDVSASTGKGVMQESIYRATLGNVLFITMFHAALERDHNADLEFSKIAYQDEKRGSYIDKTTGKHIYVELNIKEHRETDYGIHVENSKIDQEKIDMFKQFAFNASQNGDIDSASAAITYDSVPELRQALKEISEAQKKLTAATEENRNATQRYVADKTNERQEAINNTSIEVANINGETARDVADIKISATPDPDYQPDIDDDGTNAGKLALQRDQLAFKQNDANRKNDLKEKQMRTTERLTEKRLDITKNKQNSKT